MPEMPEVQGLVAFLGERAAGRTVTRTSVASIAALKTYDPPISDLHGAVITATARHGKFVDLAFGDDLHLIFHLAKAGWLRWYETLSTTLIKPGKTPIALRVALDDGSGFDLTEAGTKKSLAVYVVRDPQQVPGIARLGPDPLGEGFTHDDLAALLDGRRMQIKGLLRDQSVIAGIGNAYSDEILHAAKLSPVVHAATLTPDEVQRLHRAIGGILRDAGTARAGLPPESLKDEKRGDMHVHRKPGGTCPVCGDTIAEFTFSGAAAHYCPTCQTSGVLLS